ncbi:MAG: hypothetical protein ACUVQR_14630 [Thermogutta sp.]
MSAGARRGFLPGICGRSGGASSGRGWPVWITIYAFMSIVACRDNLATCPATLPTGKPSFAVVSLFNAWTVWWNADRLRHGFVGYWDAPIFWPEKGTFALSEPQPLTMLVAPVVWLAGPVAGYHAYFLVSLVLNGLFAQRLARRLTSNELVSGLAGALVIWLPLIFRQPELLQCTPLWPVLWTWDVALRLFEAVKVRYVVQLGLALTLSFSACIHLGLFTLLLLVIAWPWFLIRRSFIASAAFISSVFVALVFLLPMILPMLVVLRRHAESRPEEVVAFLSAAPADWLRIPENALQARLLPHLGIGKTLSPGWLRTMLGGLALASIPFLKQGSAEEKRGVLFLSLITFLAVIGSLGPNLHLFSLRPWTILSRGFQPLAMIRSPYRFAYLAQLTISLLAAIGLRYLHEWLTYLFRGRGGQVGARFTTVILAGVSLVEIPPPSPFFVPAPDYSAPPGWVIYLSEHVSRDEPVLLLDFPPTGQPIEYSGILSAMLWQPIHGHPLVNGYAAFLPAGWCDFARVWRHSPYGDRALSLLRKLGIRYLVRPPSFPAPPSDLPSGIRLNRMAVDHTGYEIWEITWGQPIPPPVDVSRDPTLGVSLARHMTQ